MAKHLNEAPPDPTTLNAEVPPELAGVVLTALAKKREDRFVSAGAMHDALEAVSNEQ